MSFTFDLAGQAHLIQPVKLKRGQLVAAQGKVYGRALVRFTFDPEIATVIENKFFTKDKAQATSFFLCCSLF